MTCGEPNDLLTIDLELKNIPRLGTCREDFAPTVDVIFKSHTSVPEVGEVGVEGCWLIPLSWTSYKE